MNQLDLLKEGYEKISGSVTRAINAMTQNGGTPQKALKIVSSMLNSNRENHNNLLKSEIFEGMTTAAEIIFKILGTSSYQIVAIDDDRTSEICKEQNGKVYDVKDFEPGVTAPPFHPNCRSIIVPYYSETDGINSIIKRWEIKSLAGDWNIYFSKKADGSYYASLIQAKGDNQQRKNYFINDAVKRIIDNPYNSKYGLDKEYSRYIDLAKNIANLYINFGIFKNLSEGSDEYYALVLNFMEYYAGGVDYWNRTLYDSVKVNVFLGTTERTINSVSTANKGVKDGVYSQLSDIEQEKWKRLNDSLLTITPERLALGLGILEGEINPIHNGHYVSNGAIFNINNFDPLIGFSARERIEIYAAYAKGKDSGVLKSWLVMNTLVSEPSKLYEEIAAMYKWQFMMSDMTDPDLIEAGADVMGVYFYGQLGKQMAKGVEVFQGLEGSGNSWYNPDGSINYPPNNGAVPGTEVKIDLYPGQSLGRYGNIGPNSNYVTAPGASPDSLSLPPNTSPSIYSELQVVKPIPGVTQSTVAPWGGSTGLGLQYELPMPIQELIKQGYLIIK